MNYWLTIFAETLALFLFFSAVFGAFVVFA